LFGSFFPSTILTKSFIHLLSENLIHLLSESFIHLLSESFIHLLSESFIHLLSESLIHLLSEIFIHLFVRKFHSPFCPKHSKTYTQVSKFKEWTSPYLKKISLIFRIHCLTVRGKINLCTYVHM
jgi:hypothetical protein